MQKKVTVMINMVMLNWTGMLRTIELDEIIFLLKTLFTPKFIFSLTHKFIKRAYKY